MPPSENDNAEEPDRIEPVAPLSAVARTVNLSSRQREVLVYVAAGRTNAEIAQALAISPRTVRMHCDALKVKLGVRKRRLIPAAYRAITGLDPFQAYGPTAHAPRAETT